VPSCPWGQQTWIVIANGRGMLNEQVPPPVTPPRPSKPARTRLDPIPGAHPGQGPLRMLGGGLLLGKPCTSEPWKWTTSCPGTMAVRTTSTTCRPSASAAMPASDGRRGQAHRIESPSPSGCLGPPSTSVTQCLAAARERTAMRS
jgi:hypothetical protein